MTKKKQIEMSKIVKGRSFRSFDCPHVFIVTITYGDLFLNFVILTITHVYKFDSLSTH